MKIQRLSDYAAKSGMVRCSDLPPVVVIKRCMAPVWELAVLVAARRAALIICNAWELPKSATNTTTSNLNNFIFDVAVCLNYVQSCFNTESIDYKSKSKFI